jgi:pimeloyl-ACP methyl ester carboxylesterase
MPTVRCHGADLYFEDEGTGPPILFLHGVMTGLRFFEPQLSTLSADHRTVALDYRGHGRSEKTETGHAVSQYARDLDAFLDRLDLDDVLVVGWSMGALVAWEYVDRFGTDRLRGLVVVDMSASAFRWDDYDHGTTDLSRLSDTLELVQTDHERLLEQTIAAAFAGPVDRDAHALAFDELSRTPPTVKSAILVDYTMRDYRDVLPGVDVPALVCAGADETWRSVAAVRDVAERLPDADFELFEESGHCLSLEEPDRFSRVVGAFASSP